MKPEIAHLITGIKVHSPHADHKRTDTDFGGSHTDLKRAVELYTSFCDSGDNMFAGEIWLNLKNEKTGQVDTAVISITSQELFLTVPA
ncbi:MAG: hypothetical protein AAB517_02955 [Patescibacteria group bacterium]